MFFLFSIVTTQTIACIRVTMLMQLGIVGVSIIFFLFMALIFFLWNWILLVYKNTGPNVDDLFPYGVMRDKQGKGLDLEVDKPHFLGFGVSYWSRTIISRSIYSTSHLRCQCIQQVAGVVCLLVHLLIFCHFKMNKCMVIKNLIYFDLMQL